MTPAERATHIIREMRQQQHSAEMIARALDAAGLLAAPEHDAAVAAKALRDFQQAILRNSDSEVQSARDVAADIPEWIATFIEREGGAS